MDPSHRTLTLLLGGTALSLSMQYAPAAQAACYQPKIPPTMGWKRVALAARASTLAADLGVDQLRSDEPVWLAEPWHYESVYFNHEHLGKTEYTFPVTASTRGTFQLYFDDSLAGAKVDITAETGSGTLWLWKDHRVGSDEVEVRWDGPRIWTLLVRVHHHLRREPAVKRFRLIRQAVLAKESWLPAEFRTPHSLYYYQPAGRTLSLCETVGRELTVEQDLLLSGGSPQLVDLQPEP